MGDVQEVEGELVRADPLLLHRGLPADAVVAGIEGALGIGSVDPAVVAIEARRSAPPVTAVTVTAIGEGLSRFDRPAPSTAIYDSLLEAR